MPVPSGCTCLNFILLGRVASTEIASARLICPAERRQQLASPPRCFYHGREDANWSRARGRMALAWPREAGIGLQKTRCIHVVIQFTWASSLGRVAGIPRWRTCV